MRKGESVCASGIHRSTDLERSSAKRTVVSDRHFLQDDPFAPEELKGNPMLAYLRKVSRRARDRGASAVEYGLMVAAIAAVIVGVVFGLGQLVQSAFNKTCSAVSSSITNNGQTCT
jgi:pilus assembly protein Flp/PilA